MPQNPGAQMGLLDDHNDSRWSTFVHSSICMSLQCPSSIFFKPFMSVVSTLHYKKNIIRCIWYVYYGDAGVWLLSQRETGIHVKCIEHKLSDYVYVCPTLPHKLNKPWWEHPRERTQTKRNTIEIFDPPKQIMITLLIGRAFLQLMCWTVIKGKPYKVYVLKWSSHLSNPQPKFKNYISRTWNMLAKHVPQKVFPIFHYWLELSKT